ncbi:DUF5919 domain-containing protein [Allorhizocola rhizosphaerae]|uniref:DUF5919 domain-containing protein n=1 Tax=Allorhizocola rhizosphaerae TaxID=1872709 RepID=UPI000E3DFB2D|nr:DUF5919 domain-containing protein [Allorhizocola rhizosphaerae]
MQIPRLGRNLELYLTAGLALVISVLGLLDIVDTPVVAAATLGTLALVALSALNSRHQVAELQSDVDELARLVRNGEGIPSADLLLTPSRSGIGLDISGATDLRLVGVTLNRTIRNLAGEMQRRLADGAHIRIALIDPDSQAPHEAARRSVIPDDAHIFHHRLTTAIDLLRELAATPRAKGRLEVRLLQFVPAFGLTLIDPDGHTGIIQVDLYSHRFLGPDPVLTLAIDREPHWYRHFALEFERIWDGGRPADFTATPQ